eukprot:snap_masked-scaffold_44-processed-gene-0.21-mRNA-1 protein AED:1.00 eAED:1.00 QI:0/0/0/0/1/1/2/0/69
MKKKSRTTRIESEDKAFDAFIFFFIIGYSLLLWLFLSCPIYDLPEFLQYLEQRVTEVEINPVFWRVFAL